MQQLEFEAPKCPECKASDFTTTHKTGAVTGTKEVYKCKNCGRSWVQDNDSFGNVYSKLVAAMVVLTQGDDAIPRAIKTLSTYSTDLENAPISRFLKLRHMGSRFQNADGHKDSGNSNSNSNARGMTTTQLEMPEGDIAKDLRDAVVSAE